MRFLSPSASSRAGVLARVGLVVLATLHLTCNQAILTAPEGSTLFLEANPKSIPAFGGVSVISARVFESLGTPVADGTVVQFFTDLGRIPEQAKTNDGVARVNFSSDRLSGRATITAFSGAIDAQTVEVMIGGGIPPSKIFLVANPTRLTTQRASQITATVVDEFGNPVPNIAVTFSIVSVAYTTPPPTPTPTPTPTPFPSPVSEEFMESRGSPVFTDNNGRAIDVMRTDRGESESQVTVTVTAQTFTGIKPDLDVKVIVN